MRFKPRRTRAASNPSHSSPGDSQTLTSERESLPFPEGGVFSAKPAPTTPSNSMKSRRSRSKPSAGSAQDLDALFNEIRSDLDKLGDLLDEPFRLNPNATDGGAPSPPQPPRRAA